jgi:hypothetical protein
VCLDPDEIVDGQHTKMAAFDPCVDGSAEAGTDGSVELVDSVLTGRTVAWVGF